MVDKDQLLQLMYDINTAAFSGIDCDEKQMNEMLKYIDRISLQIIDSLKENTDD